MGWCNDLLSSGDLQREWVDTVHKPYNCQQCLVSVSALSTETSTASRAATFGTQCICLPQQLSAPMPCWEPEEQTNVESSAPLMCLPAPRGNRERHDCESAGSIACAGVTSAPCIAERSDVVDRTKVSVACALCAVPPATSWAAVRSSTT